MCVENVRMKSGRRIRQKGWSGNLRTNKETYLETQRIRARTFISETLPDLR